MIQRATLIQVLPPGAQALAAAARLDAADALIGFHDGLTPAQAASRARNARRGLGQSWPDRAALCDTEAIDFSGVFGDDPLQILLAREAAESALSARDAAKRLRLADLTDADTAKLADAFRLTKRRAQQIKAEALAAVEAGQLDLFCGDEEKGSEP